MSDKPNISSFEALIAGQEDGLLKMSGQFADARSRVVEQRNQRVERLFLREGIKAAPAIDYCGCEVTQYLDRSGQEHGLKIHRNGKILFEAYPLPENVHGHVLQERVLHPNQDMGVDLNKTMIAGETHMRRLPDRTKVDLATGNLVEAVFDLGADKGDIAESYVFKAAANGQSGSFVHVRDGRVQQTAPAERDAAGRLRIPASIMGINGQEKLEQIFASLSVSDLGDATIQNHLRSNYGAPMPTLQASLQPLIKSQTKTVGPRASSPGMN